MIEALVVMFKNLFNKQQEESTEEGWENDKAQRLYGKDCKHCDGSGYCIDMPCPYCTGKEEEIK